MKELNSPPLYSTSQRDVWLDVLRGVAVIGVLGAHIKQIHPSIPVWLFDLLTKWRQGGWIGVDLFFVLSGFLVSGLLFKEYKRFGEINFLRFLIRRGFKIYPLFYIVLIVIIVSKLILNSPIEYFDVIGEIFFLQNYLGKLSGPHWTLAVEEHFYLFLVFCIYALTRKGSLDSFNARMNIRNFPLLVVIVLFCALIFRWINYNSSEFSRIIFMTHLRIDSLIFGSFLSWLWICTGWTKSFYPASVRLILAMAGLALLSPPFLLGDADRGFIFYVFGFIFFYVGSGCLIISGFEFCIPAKIYEFFKLISKVGTYSYAIYLIHEPFQRYFICYIFSPEGTLRDWFCYFISYIFGSIYLGFLCTKYVETPFLKLRNRLYPV